MESKWKLILHEQVEDPYFEITNGSISICANAGLVGETEDEEDEIFKRVTDALNNSGIDFHSENKLELEQHIEIQRLKYENDDLRARADKYEKALKLIRYAHKSSDSSSAWQLNQVLNIAIQTLEHQTTEQPSIPLHLTPEEINQRKEAIEWYRGGWENELRAKGDELARAARSLRLSFTAHPDYTGEPNDEWTNLVEGLDQAIAEWKGEKEGNNGNNE